MRVCVCVWACPPVRFFSFPTALFVMTSKTKQPANCSRPRPPAPPTDPTHRHGGRDRQPIKTNRFGFFVFFVFFSFLWLTRYGASLRRRQAIHQPGGLATFKKKTKEIEKNWTLSPPCPSILVALPTKKENPLRRKLKKKESLTHTSFCS